MRRWRLWLCHRWLHHPWWRVVGYRDGFFLRACRFCGDTWTRRTW